jgi:hypothetical protein
MDAPEEEVERAKKLVFHAHHNFTLVKVVVSNNTCIKKSKHKLAVDENMARIAIKAFLDKLTLLASCFNRQKYHFIKCAASGRSIVIMIMLLIIFWLLHQ